MDNAHAHLPCVAIKLLYCNTGGHLYYNKGEGKRDDRTPNHLDIIKCIHSLYRQLVLPRFMVYKLVNSYYVIREIEIHAFIVD